MAWAQIIIEALGWSQEDPSVDAIYLELVQSGKLEIQEDEEPQTPTVNPCFGGWRYHYVVMPSESWRTRDNRIEVRAG